MPPKSSAGRPRRAKRATALKSVPPPQQPSPASPETEDAVAGAAPAVTNDAAAEETLSDATVPAPEESFEQTNAAGESSTSHDDVVLESERPKTLTEARTEEEEAMPQGDTVSVVPSETLASPENPINEVAKEIVADSNGGKGKKVVKKTVKVVKKVMKKVPKQVPKAETESKVEPEDSKQASISAHSNEESSNPDVSGCMKVEEEAQKIETSHGLEAARDNNVGGSGVEGDKWVLKECSGEAVDVTEERGSQCGVVGNEELENVAKKTVKVVKKVIKKVPKKVSKVAETDCKVDSLVENSNASSKADNLVESSEPDVPVCMTVEEEAQSIETNKQKKDGLEVRDNNAGGSGVEDDKWVSKESSAEAMDVTGERGGQCAAENAGLENVVKKTVKVVKKVVKKVPKKVLKVAETECKVDNLVENSNPNSEADNLVESSEPAVSVCMTVDEEGQRIETNEQKDGLEAQGNNAGGSGVEDDKWVLKESSDEAMDVTEERGGQCGVENAELENVVKKTVKVVKKVVKKVPKKVSKVAETECKVDNLVENSNPNSKADNLVVSSEPDVSVCMTEEEEAQRIETNERKDGLEAQGNSTGGSGVEDDKWVSKESSAEAMDVTEERGGQCGVVNEEELDVAEEDTQEEDKEMGDVARREDEVGEGKLFSGELEAMERRKRRKTEIFIGGLDRDATEEDVRKVFAEAGEIVDLTLVMDSMKGKNKGYAFVRYASAADAKSALQKFSKVEIRGKECGATPVEGNDTIYLGNIDKKWKDEDVAKLLQKIGVEKVDKVTVMVDSNNSECNRGFAFVELETCKDAQIAYKKLQKKDVFGRNRNIKVAWAEPLKEVDEEEMLKVKKVYAEFIPSSWSDEKVRDTFRKYGDVDDVVLARNLRMSKRKDFAFISFKTREAAIKCIESFSCELKDEDGTKVNLKVSLAKPILKTKKARLATRTVTKEIPQMKPITSRGYIRPSDQRNRAQPNAPHYDIRFPERSSTNVDPVQLLREQASWRPSHTTLSNSRTDVYYSSSLSGTKRRFSMLEADPLYPESSRYPHPRLDASFPAASSSHNVLPPSGLPSSLAYHQQRTVVPYRPAYGTRSYLGDVETRDKAHRSSIFYHRF